MIIRFLFLILLFLCQVSCSRNTEISLPEDLNQQYPIAFETSNIKTPNGISVQAGLWANATGDTILFHSRIKNNAKTKIKISPYSLQIQTQEGYRSNPLTQSKELSVQPNSTKFVTYRFSPVNNKFLYLHTGNKGDLDSCYLFNLNFIRDINGKSLTDSLINFNVKKEAFKNYKQKYAKDQSFSLYELSKENQENRRKQLDYLQSLRKSNLTGKSKFERNLKPSLRFSETEIMMDGVILTSKFFHVNDSLFLNLRLVNHGIGSLHFVPDSIHIVNSDSGNQIKQYPTGSAKSELILRKGDRFQALLNFGYYENPPQEIIADFSALKYSPQKNKLFTVPLSYTKRSLK